MSFRSFLNSMLPELEICSSSVLQSYLADLDFIDFLAVEMGLLRAKRSLNVLCAGHWNSGLCLSTF